MPEDKDIDLTDDLGDVEEESFDDDSDFSELTSATSQELCDIVITFRYLGVFKARAIACMKELGMRRAAGDSFNFEEYIKTESKTLPDINMVMPKMSSPLGGIFKK